MVLVLLAQLIWRRVRRDCVPRKKKWQRKNSAWAETEVEAGRRELLNIMDGVSSPEWSDGDEIDVECAAVEYEPSIHFKYVYCFMLDVVNSLQNV
jgi:hypothetical protein